MQPQAGTQRTDGVFAMTDQKPNGNVTTFLESGNQPLLITALTRYSSVQ